MRRGEAEDVQEGGENKGGFVVLLHLGLAVFGIHPLISAHREFVRFAATRTQTCPVLGQALKPEDTVVVDLNGIIQQVLTVCGETFDRFIRPRIKFHQTEGTTVEVFDGRLLFSPYEPDQEEGWEIYRPDREDDWEIDRPD